MKTVIFCTSYAESSQHWSQVYIPWLDNIKRSGLVYDQLIMADDGSPELPNTPGCLIVNEGTILDSIPDSEVLIYKFTHRLGRPSLFNFPGHYRSFTWAGWFAHKFKFDKAIHIEADACVISDRFVNYLNNFEFGWEAFYCPHHSISETAIQIIAGSECVEAFSLYHQIDYSHFKGQSPDARDGYQSYYPFEVNRSFIGDRYAEYTKTIPSNADYACQVYPNIKRWWLDTQHDHS